MLVCPDCTTTNFEGSFFCQECGMPLIGDNLPVIQRTPFKETNKLDTTQLPANPNLWGTSLLSVQSAIMIRFGHENIEVTIPTNLEFILGRRDEASNNYPDLDLTPQGGIDLGVSRKHAAFRRNDQTLTLVDLGSANGTYLNGQKINPNQPHILRDGDELRFGQLVSHIFFKPEA